MVTLLIVRHAKTEWNKAGRIQGISDIPLASESEVAALNVGRELDKHIDAVYCSPLCRARKTAEKIAEGHGGGLKVISDSRLTERNFGAFEGRTYDELGLDDHTRLFYALENVEGVEPSEQVFDRVRSFVCQLERENDGQTVLIVSHGVCISYLVYALTHEKWNESEYEMKYIKNLTVAQYEAGV